MRLREMWEKARATHPVLDDFDINPYYVLQVIAVNVRRSPQRAVVLALDVPDIVDHWDEAIEGLAGSLILVRDECGVLVSKWVPYETMLITMASGWRSISAVTGPALGARRAKLARWFWCSSFAQSYENAGNTVTERDVPELRRWLEGGDEPEIVASFRFDSNRWRETTVRQRALYRATMALLMRDSPRDFHEATPLSKPIIDGRAVDDHHVFPRKYLFTIGKGKTVDSVLNHTLIDRLTNVRIGGRAPSDYLSEMERELGSNLAKILESHGLPPEKDGPLFEDLYEHFLDWRLRHLERELSDVTHGEVGPAVGPMEIEPRLDVTDQSDDQSVSTDREAIEHLVSQLVHGDERAFIDGFINEVASWPDVRVWIGQNKTLERRRIFFSRQRSPYGAFAWIQPHENRARFRLSRNDVGDTSLAEVLDRKDAYNLRILLEDQAAMAEALGLARRAYNQAIS